MSDETRESLAVAVAEALVVERRLYESPRGSDMPAAMKATDATNKALAAYVAAKSEGVARAEGRE